MEKITTRDIDIALNEYVTRFSVNRNIKKLLQNDKIIYKAYISAIEKLDILEYIPYSVSHTAYSINTMVWFKDSNNKLWILKCIKDNNTTSPNKAIYDLDQYGLPNFENYGWMNLNKYYSIDQLDIESYIYTLVDQYILDHQDEEEHKFGRLSEDTDDDDFYENKIMLKDMSNVVQDRMSYQYPCLTGRFNDDTILNCIYRIWTCGIIEFDIVFKLGYTGKDTYGRDVLTCNNVKFNYSTSIYENSGYQQNSKYFLGQNDGKIFMNRDDMEVFEHVDYASVQKNRNKYVNTYFGVLNLFPEPIKIGDQTVTNFMDLNYMIFGIENTTCGDSQSKQVHSVVNQLTWGNKTHSSITAILITQPDTNEDLNSFAKHSGIFSNTFGCHIIGRWK